MYSIVCFLSRLRPGSFGNRVGTTLGPCWDRVGISFGMCFCFGTAVGPVWDRDGTIFCHSVGIMSGSSGNHFWGIWEYAWCRGVVLDRVGAVLGSIWDCCGTVLGPFWNRFDSMGTDMTWDPFGIVLVQFGNRVGIVLFRIVLASFWDMFGIVLDRVGMVLGSVWDRLGTILGSFWDRLGYICTNIGRRMKHSKLH